MAHHFLFQLALQKQKEEGDRLRLAEEEAQRKWQEEEDARLEEERKKEEIKLKKKEKEKVWAPLPPLKKNLFFTVDFRIFPLTLQLKKEELKKQGKYMTKAEKDRIAQLEERRAKLGLSGVVASGENAPAATEEAKPKKVVYGKRKKPTGKQATEQGQAANEEEEEEESGGEEETPAHEVQPVTAAQVTSPQASEEGLPSFFSLYSFWCKFLFIYFDVSFLSS